MLGLALSICLGANGPTFTVQKVFIRWLGELNAHKQTHGTVAGVIAELWEMVRPDPL